MSQYYLIGSYQHATGIRRTGFQGSLAGGEEVELTFTFLFDGLFFKMLNIFGL